LKGSNVPTTTLTTSGVGVALKATADRSKIDADRNDLSYVVVEVVDSDGNRVPDARQRLNFVSNIAASY
jgi:beta-galactosidase